MLKASELRNLSKQELKEKVDSLRKDLYELRTKNTTGRIEKPSDIGKARRDIARILTVLNEKEKEK